MQRNLWNLQSRSGPTIELSAGKMKDSLGSSVESSLNDPYIAAEGASLRREDFRRAKQVASMLIEIERPVKSTADPL
jgi:hypothetical protein